MTEFDDKIITEMLKINKQVDSGYLSKKKVKNMEPTELLMNRKMIEDEIEKRGLGMLFGV